jgi:hypothetical protein
MHVERVISSFPSQLSRVGNVVLTDGFFDRSVRIYTSTFEEIKVLLPA